MSLDRTLPPPRQLHGEVSKGVQWRLEDFVSGSGGQRTSTCEPISRKFDRSAIDLECDFHRCLPQRKGDSIVRLEAPAEVCNGRVAPFRRRSAQRRLSAQEGRKHSRTQCPVSENKQSCLNDFSGRKADRLIMPGAGRESTGGFRQSKCPSGHPLLHSVVAALDSGASFNLVSSPHLRYAQ
jgi:hypothetical protein